MKLGMYSNKGNIALAQKLNDALFAMPDDLTAEQRVMFVDDFLRADSEFCGKYGEWQDSDVRDSISSWAESPTKMSIRERRATIEVGFHFPVGLMTLDGDVGSALDERSDEIHAIVEGAVKDALCLIEERVGRIAGEWSGVEIAFPDRG